MIILIRSNGSRSHGSRSKKPQALHGQDAGYLLGLGCSEEGLVESQLLQLASHADDLDFSRDGRTNLEISVVSHVQTTYSLSV
jgi:hypothetical protein